MMKKLAFFALTICALISCDKEEDSSTGTSVSGSSDLGSIVVSFKEDPMQHDSLNAAGVVFLYTSQEAFDVNDYLRSDTIKAGRKKTYGSLEPGSYWLKGETSEYNGLQSEGVEVIANTIAYVIFEEN